MKRAFTLVETLLYLGLFSAFLVVLVTIFGTVLDVQLGTETTASVARDGNYILNRLTYDIHRGAVVTIPAAAGQQASQIQMTIGGEVFTYLLSGGDLVMTNNSGTANLNGYDTRVTNFGVTRVGNAVNNARDTLSIAMTVTSKVVPASGKPAVRSFQTTVGLR